MNISYGKKKQRTVKAAENMAASAIKRKDTENNATPPPSNDGPPLCTEEVSDGPRSFSRGQPPCFDTRTVPKKNRGPAFSEAESAELRRPDGLGEAELVGAAKANKDDTKTTKGK